MLYGKNIGESQYYEINNNIMLVQKHIIAQSSPNSFLPVTKDTLHCNSGTRFVCELNIHLNYFG